MRSAATALVVAQFDGGNTARDEKRNGSICTSCCKTFRNEESLEAGWLAGWPARVASAVHSFAFVLLCLAPCVDLSLSDHLLVRPKYFHPHTNSLTLPCVTFDDGDDEIEIGKA